MSLSWQEVLEEEEAPIDDGQFVDRLRLMRAAQARGIRVVTPRA